MSPKKLTDFSHIKGWGHDADPENDPTWPMRTRYDGDNNGMNWQRPPKQRADVEVLHSNERPDLTAVFGTTVPPKDISGTIRRFAFKFSESNWIHWLSLILADRIQVIESDLADLAHGHIPNIFAERGMKAEMKYNSQALTNKLIIGLSVLAIALAFYPRKES